MYSYSSSACAQWLSVVCVYARPFIPVCLKVVTQFQRSLSCHQGGSGLCCCCIETWPKRLKITTAGLQDAMSVTMRHTCIHTVSPHITSRVESLEVKKNTSCKVHIHVAYIMCELTCTCTLAEINARQCSSLFLIKVFTRLCPLPTREALHHLFTNWHDLSWKELYFKKCVPFLCEKSTSMPLSLVVLTVSCRRISQSTQCHLINLQKYMKHAFHAFC